MKWISVEDRLPSNDITGYNAERYWVYLERGMQVEGIYVFRTGEWRTGRATDVYEDVTHWMPLPEPPEQ